MTAKQVVMIHDGAIDEFVAEVLLASSPDIDLLAVIMVDADCIGSVACEVMWQVNNLAGLEVPIGLSAARAANPFPWAYRSDCLRTADLPILRRGRRPPLAFPPNGDDILGELLDTTSEPLTILSTGPVTPLTQAIRQKPERAAMVSDLVWMAGAINVQGNLDPATLPPGVANPYAEWNVFWDPESSSDLLHYLDCPITLVPLDASTKLPIDQTFMSQLLHLGRSGGFARLCLDAYGLISDEPFYRLWDTATVAWILAPDLFAKPTKSRIRVETDPTGDVGALVQDPAGTEVDLILDFARGGSESICEFILSAIARVPPHK